MRTFDPLPAKAEPDSSALQRLRALIGIAGRRSAFYMSRWRDAGVLGREIETLDDLRRFPLTSRAELQADQDAHPPLGTSTTQPAGLFRFMHRSSGTSGRPLLRGDTLRSQECLRARSEEAWRLTGVTRADRVLLLVACGDRLGPWVLRDGLRRLGCAFVVAGSATLDSRLDWLDRFRPTVLAGRPDDILRLGNEGRKRGMTASLLGVTRNVCIGQPGAADPAVRSELRSLFHAEVFDRYGLTEAGTVAAECRAHRGGMHLLDHDLIAEVIDPATGEPAADGEEGELVLTCLDRLESPLVRYRTGDLTRMDRGAVCPCGHPGPLLTGGVRRAGR